MRLVHEFLEASAARVPGKTALVAGGRRLTYAQVDADAARLAAALRAYGVMPGERVAIFADNGPELVIGIFAALKAGAAFVPINAQTKADKLTRLLDDCGAAALVTTAVLGGAWRPALARSASLKACIVSGLAPGDSDERLHSFDAALEALTALPEIEAQPQDLAAILYTSGSTGEPKGVMLTHLNMVSAARSVNAYLGLSEDDVIVSALPAAFSYGLYQVLLAFRAGATIVLEHSFTFPVRVLETVAREGATVFPGVPAMFSMILGMASLAAFDLRRLRMVTSAGAALAERHVRELRRLFPQALLYSMYGLTECKRASYLPPEELDRRPGSVGRGMPDQEAWLVDERGNRLPHGSTGELVIRGPHVMRGYWNRPGETAERLKPGPTPGEVVLHSGDVFRSDAEGYLYFVARKDDIIKSRGEKVSPREVEDVLYGLEGVKDAAVVGIPDDVLGQAIKAFVVLHPGCTHTEKHILRHCQGALESFMVPRQVAIVSDLPRTDTGKISKSGLQ